MKFRLSANQELLAEKHELQPAFVKGALAAHGGETEDNPYIRESFREAWKLGYQGVMQGKVTVVDESVTR